MVSSENTISKIITYKFGKLIVIYLSVTVLLNSGCNNLQDARELTNKTQDTNNKFENSGDDEVDSANQMRVILGKDFDALSNDEKSFWKSYNTRTMDYDDIIAMSNSLKKEFNSIRGDDLAMGKFFGAMKQTLSQDQFVIFKDNLNISKKKLLEEQSKLR